MDAMDCQTSACRPISAQQQLYYRTQNIGPQSQGRPLSSTLSADNGTRSWPSRLSTDEICGRNDDIIVRLSSPRPSSFHLRSARLLKPRAEQGKEELPIPRYSPPGRYEKMRKLLFQCLTLSDNITTPQALADAIPHRISWSLQLQAIRPLFFVYVL